MEEAWILDGARTPFAVWARGRKGDGSRGGALRELDPFDLGAAALKDALRKSGVPAAKVERVVFSNMYHDGAYGCYGARYVSLRAGIDPKVPCLTDSMACGSGLHAFFEAAKDILLGEAGVVAAGGTDNISRLPKEIFVPSFKDLGCGGRNIGETVEPLAAEEGITRADMDRWALASHRRARAAQKAGLLAEEIVPVGGVSDDDAVLPDPAPEAFAEARPSFDKEHGTVTPMNTHALVDGASAVILASRAAAEAGNYRPLGRFAAGAYSADRPDRMSLAAIPAAEEALRKAGWTPAEVDLFEINETFAGQLLLDLKLLGIDEEKVNVNGGAVALGHPFAGTGCRQVVTLLYELRRRGLKKGLASICVGGGQGVAVAVENLA